MTNQHYKVVKRNGKTVDYDSTKIRDAVAKAFKACGIDTNMWPETVAEAVTERVKKTYTSNEAISINMIQNLVEEEMMKLFTDRDFPYEVARKYIVYRDRRDKDRDSINKLAIAFHDVVDIEDNDLKKSNANINGNTPAGQMMIFGSESSKQHAMDYIINPKYVQAHTSGHIHIHDLDYVSTKAWNCNQISLKDIFSHPYIHTVDSIMRPPQRISSYAALAAIVFQSEQNEMFGGQSVMDWEYAMADGVRKTFREQFKKIYKLIYHIDCPFVDEQIYMDNKALKDSVTDVYQAAYDETVHETHEAMVAFVYNLCSMHSRGGAQVVFSSINYGTDYSTEGRLVINETLNAVDEGLGDGSTAIFPISVFKVKDDVNFSEEDWELAKNNWDDAVAGKLKFKTPNFDLFIKACVVSARRLFPNFVFEDSTYNQNPLWDINDPDRYKYELAVMGCRTRVYDDLYGEKTSARRGNLSFTTINLPRLAIESRIELGDKASNEEVIKLFYKKLDYMLNLVRDQLLERYHWQCSAYARQFPFIVQNGTVMGTEGLKPDDKVGDALKHGSLSIGFIGLAETLKELIGKHHGESDEAEQLGLEIVKHMREYTDKCTEEEQLNFSLFFTPAEGLCGRFTHIDAAEFGIIPGVTDRDFYTNSVHVPVYYNIGAHEKILKEAPFHEYGNAGSILYVEMDGDPLKNTLAFATVVVDMKHNNVNYGAINHAVDRCLDCGYEGVIPKGEACPKCGDTEDISHLRRITGYLVGSTDRWNSGKLAELKARVKHI